MEPALTTLHNAYSKGQPKIIHASMIDAKGHLLETEAAKAFVLMRDAAYAENVSLIVNSAFRTMEEQSRLYRDYMDGKTKAMAAKPGYSNHQSGIALDIESGNGTNKAFKWLEKNAAKFGFKRTVKSEPWHWEYRGRADGKI